MKVLLKISMNMVAIVLAGSLLAITPACAQKIKGNGKVVEQERELNSFNSLDISGAVEVILIQGSEELAIVEADENLMDYIFTEVKGSTLKIYTKDIKSSDELKVTVKLKELSGIEISGAVSLKSKSVMNTESLIIDCSGAAKMELEVTTQSIECDISGGSKLKLEGSTRDLEMDVSGAASVDAFDLKAINCEFDISGAAKAEISCNKKLEVEVSGTAKIVYKGNPEVEKSVSGVASVSKYSR